MRVSTVYKRFPALELLIYTSLNSAVLHKYVGKDILSTTLIIVSLLHLLFIFHLRVLDEIKDYKYDKKNHPDRPFVLSKKYRQFVFVLGIFCLLSMIILSYLLSGKSIMIFIGILLYTALMFKEFFIKNFYERITVIYIFFHELVFFFLFLFFIYSLDGNFRLEYFFLSIFLVIPLLIIEIGRKMNYRFDSTGQKTIDTYFYIWGERKTIALFGGLIMSASMLSMSLPSYNIFSSVILFFLGSFFFVYGYKFRKSIEQNSQMITVFCTLFVLFISLV